MIFTFLFWVNIAEAISLKKAYESHKSNIQVKGRGTLGRTKTVGFSPSSLILPTIICPLL